MNTEELVAAYVEMRDAKDALKREQADALKPFDSMLDRLEGELLRALVAAGGESIKTPAGTAYKSRWTKARVADWSAVVDYAVQNQRFDLFERRVSKAIVEEIGQVPGVEVDSGISVNVRRS